MLGMPTTTVYEEPFLENR